MSPDEVLPRPLQRPLAEAVMAYKAGKFEESGRRFSAIIRTLQQPQFVDVGDDVVAPLLEKALMAYEKGDGLYCKAQSYFQAKQLRDLRADRMDVGRLETLADEFYVSYVKDSDGSFIEDINQMAKERDALQDVWSMYERRQASAQDPDQLFSSLLHLSKNKYWAEFADYAIPRLSEEIRQIPLQTGNEQQDALLYQFVQEKARYAHVMNDELREVDKDKQKLLAERKRLIEQGKKENYDGVFDKDPGLEHLDFGGMEGFAHRAVDIYSSEVPHHVKNKKFSHLLDFLPKYIGFLDEIEHEAMALDAKDLFVEISARQAEELARAAIGHYTSRKDKKTEHGGPNGLGTTKSPSLLERQIEQPKSSGLILRGSPEFAKTLQAQQDKKELFERLGIKK